MTIENNYTPKTWTTGSKLYAADMNAISATLDKVEEDFYDFSAEQEAKNAAVETSLTSLGEKDTAIEGKVTTAEGKITALEAKAEALESGVSTIGGKVTTLEGHETVVAGKFETITNSLTVHSSSINTISAAVTELSETVESVEGTVQETQETTAGAVNNIETIFSAVTEIRQLLNTLSAKVAVIEANFGEPTIVTVEPSAENTAITKSSESGSPLAVKMTTISNQKDGTATVPNSLVANNASLFSFDGTADSTIVNFTATGE